MWDNLHNKFMNTNPKSDWLEKPLSIKDLTLWDENARFPEEYFNQDEVELVRFFLKKEKDFKIESLAREIVKDFDLPQLEKIVVLSIKGKNVALEGNRRLTVYKLLNNPDLAKDFPNTHKLFRELSKSVKISPAYKLQAIVTKSKDEGLRFVDRKHNRGNNEVGWGEPERRNFAVRRSHGNNKDVLRVALASAVKKLDLPESIKEEVLGKGLVTTFYRIVDSAASRSKLGYEVQDDGSIKIKDQEKFNKILKIIVHNVWSKKDFSGKSVDSRTLNKAESISDYVSSLKAGDISKVSKEIKSNTKENLFGEEIVLSPRKTKSNPVSAERKFLINSPIFIKDARINDIYDELRKRLEVDVTPNAVAVLFRVFMESSIDCYIETHNLQVKDETKLAGKILKVIDHLEDAIALQKLSEESIDSPSEIEFKKMKEKVKFKSMRKVATKDNNSMLSVDTFHDFVHDYKTSPISSELKKHWDNLGSFFVALWDSLSKKK